MSKYTEEQLAWIKSRPPKVQEAIERVPPKVCLRISGKGHYVVYAYEECLDGSVTVQVIHLDDSFMPGLMVFGVPLDEITLCRCRDN